MDPIELVPMTPAQYDAWLPGAIADYADENIVSGRWSKEEAEERSREEFARLLPQGVATPEHHVWSIVRASDRTPVGVLWIHVMQKPRPIAFIYNIEIDPAFRRRGYAEQAMLKLEDEARRMALEGIRLHVFGHNSAARPLYEKLGYVATNLQMLKRLT
ncbi:MAG TPA: GNAT family N-acetyltransferase [Patescibacteria group bacterium]|nr:GNAT family N-acetyltransferase [Patescibacteria group bacterium]